MSLILYYAPQTRALRVLWALEELGIPYEKRRLDLSKGEHKTPEYLAINPNGKVPALVVDGQPMFESSAMVIYLGQRFGAEKGLWPAAGDPKLASALGWVVWEPATVALDMFRIVFASSEMVPKEQHNAAAATAARTELDKHFGVLEAHLKDREFVMGDGFTFVDLALVNPAMFAKRIGIDLARWPALVRWSESVSSRPALARAREL